MIVKEYRVCEVAGLEPGASVRADLEGIAVGVWNVDGEIVAYRDLCPHQSAPICAGQVTGTMLPSSPGSFTYGLHNRVIRCPWHGWEFDLLTGDSLFTGDRRRLSRLATEIVDGWVIVKVKRREPAAARA